MRIGGVRRDSELSQRLGCLEAIEFGDENQIRMERCDEFQARVSCPAYFGFLLGAGRVIAIVGVADQAVLEAESVDGLRQAWSE